jgi:hypothetical protein
MIHKTLKSGKIISLAVGALFCAAIYISGPESKLTLLSRLHYNTVYLLTPCSVGETRKHSDESISFEYIAPPKSLIVRHADGGPLNGFHRKNWLDEITDATILDSGIDYALKFRLPAKAQAELENQLRESAQVVADTGFVYHIRKENDFAAEGENDYLYAAGKNRYFYRILLPVYPNRDEDKWLLVRALHAAGMLNIQIGSEGYPIYAPTFGFVDWFFQPSAEKLSYCSAKRLRATVREIAE